jgi:hypothetical protein
MQSASAPGGAGSGADQVMPVIAKPVNDIAGSGRRGLIDEHPLLREQRTSIIRILMAAFGPETDMRLILSTVCEPFHWLESLQCRSLVWGVNMRRREFMGLVGGAAAAWPLVAHAQKQPLRIGFLASGTAGSASSVVQIGAIKQGLSENGLIEGRDYQPDKDRSQKPKKNSSAKRSRPALDSGELTLLPRCSFERTVQFTLSQRLCSNDDFQAITSVEFLHQDRHVVFDGLLADPKRNGDLLIGLAT